MFLRDMAKVIYAENTASENTTIIVKTYSKNVENERILWTGKAKDLKDWVGLGGWIVVEMLIDPNTDVEEFPGIETPLYNRGKIIRVI